MDKFGISQYGSTIFQYPENLRLKKNEETAFKFRYNILINSTREKCQKVAATIYGLVEVEDIRIVDLNNNNYNLWVHCNAKVKRDILEEACIYNFAQLLKITSYKFNPGLEKTGEFNYE